MGSCGGCSAQRIFGDDLLQAQHVARIHCAHTPTPPTAQRMQRTILQPSLQFLHLFERGCGHIFSRIFLQWPKPLLTILLIPWLSGPRGTNEGQPMPTITTPMNARTMNRHACDDKANPRFGGSPLGFEAGDANLYRYVRNAPTDAIDPSGLIWEPDGLGGWRWVGAGQPTPMPSGDSRNAEPILVPPVGPGPALPLDLLTPPTEEERRNAASAGPDGNPQFRECGIPVRGIVRLVGSLFSRGRAVGGAVTTATIHGAQQLAARGFTPQMIVDTRAGHVLRQADGCIVYVRQVESGRFNFIVQNAEGAIVTALARVDGYALRNFAINYGWTAP